MNSTIDWSSISKTGEIPHGLSLFAEERAFNVLNSRVVTESKTGKKRMRLTGIIQKSDSYNENGRIYSSTVLEEAVDAIQDGIISRKIMGELDHSSDAKIHMDRISHLMTKVWMEGDKVFGELEVIEEMPCGKMLKALIEAGVTVGISSRGVGDMRPIMVEDIGEAYEVLPGYRFITWDIVAEPSVKEAELSVLESKNRILKPNRKQIESKIINEIRNSFKA